MDSLERLHLVQTGPELYEAGLAYRYQMPEAAGPYPTAVLLHGRLGNEDVMWIFRRAIPQNWLVVAPRAPLADKDGLHSWNIQESDAEWPELKDLDPAVDVLSRFIKAMTRLYNADPDQIYLIGFSQGAAVAFSTVLQNPKVARGVAGLVGFMPRAETAEIADKLDGLPIFMAAGAKDKTVPLEVARASSEALRTAGADLDYREYPTGHKLNAAGFNDLRNWLTNTD